MSTIDLELTPPQFDFARHEARYPAIVSGYGAGKTHALACRLLALKLKHRKCDVAYYAPTYDLIRLIAWPRFQDMLSAWGLSYTLNKSENRLQIRGYGSVIFRTMDNPERIVGYEVAHSGVDELDTLKTDNARDAWNRIIARNRQKMGRGNKNTVAVATTPEGYRFVYQRWQKQPAEGYALIRASTYSNQKNLPEGYIDSLRQSYPSQLLDAYLEGKFVNLTSGSVYPEFSRTLNHTDETIQAREPLHIGMDFNVYNMTATVAVIRNDLPLVTQELTGIRDTPAMIETIRERYPDHPITIYPDASGASASSQGASQSDINLLRRAFTVRVPRANPPIRDRVMAVNALLCNADGYRRLKINSAACPVLTESLEQQIYDKSGQPDKTQGHDHIVDALGYFIHQRWPIQRQKPTLSEIAF